MLWYMRGVVGLLRQVARYRAHLDTDVFSKTRIFGTIVGVLWTVVGDPAPPMSGLRFASSIVHITLSLGDITF